MNESLALLIAGLIIFCGYFGSVFFQRTRIPDILFLIFIGVLIGPILKWLSLDNLKDVTPYFGKLALIIVLFEGGLHLDFNTLYKNIGYAVFLGVGIFLFTLAAIFGLFVYVFNWPEMAALMLGGVLGGTSSAIVIPLVQKMNLSENSKTNLNLESVLTDIFVVLVVIVSVEISLLGKIEAGTVFNKLAGSFAIAIVIGFIVAMAWVAALRILQKTPLAYMTTLAMAVTVYSVVEITQASGAIAVFTFGMVLRNADRFLRILDVHQPFQLDNKIELFHAEWTFFVRTYFFVLLGLYCTPERFTEQTVTYGLAAFGCVMVARLIGVLLFRLVNKESKPDFVAYFTMVSRGLAAAIMATIPAKMLLGQNNALYNWVEPFMSYTIIVVLLTNLFTVVGVFVSEQQKKSRRQFVEPAN